MRTRTFRAVVGPALPTYNELEHRALLHVRLDISPYIWMSALMHQVALNLGLFFGCPRCTLSRLQGDHSSDGGGDGA